MSYLLYQANNIVGVFDDFHTAKNMADGIIENGWASDFSIVKYKKNSCVKVETIKIDNKEEEEVINEENKYIELKSDEEPKKDKGEIQRQLNFLNIQKDKLEESKNKYDVDLKLYYEFKKKLEEDINFVIPELFEEKYKLFHQLESQDNLNWETFALLYKEEDFHGNMASVFDVTNDFEKKFLTSIDSDTESDSSDEDDSEESESTDNIIEIVQVLNSSEEDSSSID